MTIAGHENGLRKTGYGLQRFGGISRADRRSDLFLDLTLTKLTINIIIPSNLPGFTYNACCRVVAQPCISVLRRRKWRKICPGKYSGKNHLFEWGTLAYASIAPTLSACCRPLFVANRSRSPLKRKNVTGKFCDNSVCRFIHYFSL